MDTAKLTSLLAAADTGSLSAAARQLGLQLSTVSRQLADLEAEVGTALLLRTGRGVRMTAAGERYVERARHIVREVEAAAADARGERGAELGQLRLSAPVELALRVLPPVLAALATRHPTLGIDVHSDARRVSLLEEDFDCAIRLGALRDSELVARKLGAVSLVLCARPDRAKGVRHVSDLRGAEHVLVAGARTSFSVTLRGRAVRLRIEGRCRVSTFSEAALLAACSERLALLPSFAAVPYVASGQLVRVLPNLVVPRADVQLVYTSRYRGSRVIEDLGDLVAAALDACERAV